MKNDALHEPPHRHSRVAEPAPWVRRFQALAPAGGTVLDLACGGGRHGRLFIACGHRVVFLDKDASHVKDLASDANAEVVEADIETGSPVFEAGGPLAGRTFAAIVVVNYLHRPLLGPLVDAVGQGGVLIYETFARGNERFRRPRNPDHLLKPGELLELARGRLRVVAYEHGLIEDDALPGVKQRLCAVNDMGLAAPADGEPEQRPLFPKIRA